MTASLPTPPEKSAGDELPSALLVFAMALHKLDTSNAPSEALTAFEQATSAVSDAFQTRLYVEHVNPPSVRGSVMPRAHHDQILSQAADTAMEAADRLLASALDNLLQVLRTHFPEAASLLRDLLPPIARYVAAHPLAPGR
jgi:hypothetical protein